MRNCIFFIIIVVCLCYFINYTLKSNIFNGNNLFSKYNKEGLANLSENWGKISNYKFDLPEEYYRRNESPFTHPPTQWAVCNSIIKNINNNIIGC